MVVTKMSLLPQNTQTQTHILRHRCIDTQRQTHTDRQTYTNTYKHTETYRQTHRVRHTQTHT